jgi:hypothetical protein
MMPEKISQRSEATPVQSIGSLGFCETVEIPFGMVKARYGLAPGILIRQIITS